MTRPTCLGFDVTSLLLVCCLTLAASVTCRAGEAAPDFERPLLTPVPVGLADAEEAVFSLDGAWRFQAGPPEKFYEASLKVDDWPMIAVPGQWFMQGFEVPRGQLAGYRRVFRVPDDWTGLRVILRFEAVYDRAVVWLNGRRLGEHMGGFTPFEFDVTDQVAFGKENVLAISVDGFAWTDSRFTTFGSLYKGMPLGGILRKVRVFAVPDVHLASFVASTTFDPDSGQGGLNLNMVVRNGAKQGLEDPQVRVQLTREGRTVVSQTTVLALPAPGGEASQSVRLDVAQADAWDAEHPNLYRLECQLLDGDRSLETLVRRIGFRQVEVRGPQLLVNGRPVKLRGVCRHEMYADCGRSLREPLWRESVELFREANINLIRTSHYPPAEELIDACDELGMYVLEEAPMHHAVYQPDDAEYTRVHLQQTAEMIQRDRSHPSVIAWSLGNEATWSENFERAALLAARLDPTRPRVFAGGDGYCKQYKAGEVYRGLEIASTHYPGLQKMDRLLEASNKPLIFDEFCHLNVYNRTETMTDPGLRNYWAQCLEAIWEKMVRHEACLGGALWAGVDEIVELPDGGAVGWGPWGLIDAWYRRKPEFWHTKKIFSPTRIVERQIEQPGPGEPIVLEVENRHDFTNLNELRITWQVGDSDGTVSAKVAPRTTGKLLIRPAAQAHPGDLLRITFHSPEGGMIDTYAIPIVAPGGERTTATPPQPPAKAENDHPTLSIDKEQIVIGDSDTRWVISRTTGQVASLTVDGRPVLVGGPKLMLLEIGQTEFGQVHGDVRSPLNHTCHGWKVQSVEGVQGADGVILVTIAGRYEEAEGRFTLRFDSARAVSVGYEFTCQKAIAPRQIGAVLDVARVCDTLAWDREARWSVYPEDHIGRSVGTARAMRPESFPKREAGVRPSWPWALDETPLGTNDFRATRANILKVALTDGSGVGIRVGSDGRHAARAYLDGNRIGLLIASYSNEGGERFLGTRYFADRRRKLAVGDTVKDEFVVHVVTSE